MSAVAGYLVTGSEAQRLDHWRNSCAYANWLDVRGETAHVMVFDDQREHFIEAARVLGLTVQVIEGAAGDETYPVLTGTEDAGWTDRKALKWASEQTEQARTEHDDFLEELMQGIGDEWDGDNAAESIAISYVRHLEAEVDRLGGDRRPAWCAENDADASTP